MSHFLILCEFFPAAARHQFRLRHQEEPGLSRVTTARFLPLLLLAELFIGYGRFKSHLQRRKEEKFYFRKKMRIEFPAALRPFPWNGLFPFPKLHLLFYTSFLWCSFFGPRQGNLMENGISFDGTVLWRYRLHSKQSGA